MKIGDFSREIGVSTNLLRKWHELGILVPHAITPTGIRIYTDEQVIAYKNGDYSIPTDDSYSTSEFSEKTGVSESTLYKWKEIGRLVPDHVNEQGFSRYSKAQVDKYFAGEYDCMVEEGFINRESFAQLLGVSESLVIQWNSRGLLVPDHKTITRVWQYLPQQLEDAKKLIKYKKLDKTRV